VCFSFIFIKENEEVGKVDFWQTTQSSPKIIIDSQER